MSSTGSSVSLRGGAGSLTDGAGSFRCDNAPIFVRQSIPSGCVFPTIGRFQRLSLSDPATSQASNHVWTAIFDPNSTNPPGDNKFIVGGLNSLTPLTRVTDKHTIDTNRRRARGACLKYDTNYKQNRKNPADPLDCDEFPFASTYQGAASGGDFSVRGISAADNQTAGRRLGDWYNTFRVLDGDAFFVEVRP